MVSVRTLLLQNGNFVPLDEFDQLIHDPEYLAGVLLVSSDSRTLMDEEYGDLIEVLWSLVVDCLARAKKYGKATTSFPDQPIDISVLYFQKAQRVVMKLEWDGESKEIEAYSMEFFEAFKRAGLHFFSKMKSISPQESSYYSGIMDILRALPD